MKIFYRTAILLLAFCYVSFDAFSQDYVIKAYTIDDGLPQSQVDDICQDSFGYLWVATRGGGLGKFDGKTFTTYKTSHGLPSNLITKVLWSQDKKLWVGTYDGLSVFDGKAFKNYELHKNNSRKSVTALAEDDQGNIWVATLKGGVYKISKTEITYYGAKGGFTDHVIRKIIHDPIGERLWFCSPEGGLKYLSGNTFHSFEHPSINEIPPVLSIHSDNDEILIGTKSGLYKIPATSNQIEKVPGAANHWILEIKKDASGIVWLGTGFGIIRIIKDEVEVLDHNLGISPVPVNKIFEDSEGLIWFSGDNLNSSSNMKFKKIDVSDGLPQAMVMSVDFDPDDNLWIGMVGGGISKFNPSDKKNILENFSIPESVHCGIVDNEGIPWFSNGRGIYKFQDNKLIYFDVQNIIPHAIFESVFKDMDGNIWLGSLNNLVQYKDGIFKNFELPQTDHSKILRSFGQLKNGQILIGTNNGLYQILNDTIEKLDIPELSSQSIMNILEDEKGMVWMGLYGDGLIRWDPKNNDVKIYTEEDGLTSNLIYCMIFDNTGRLWVGSEKGIDFLTFDKNHNIHQVKNFGKNEGFMGIETNHNAITKDKKGNIWVGTVKGVYTFDPENIKINSTPPQLSLSGIKLYHEIPDWNSYATHVDSWQSLPDFIKVPYNKNHLTFIFQAINFQNPQKIYYSYKLVNFDEKWSPTTETREAVYANLPPGDYTFMVRSKNEDGIWNEDPVSYSFSIESPFWMRWWFYILLISIFLLLSRFIYKQLIKNKLKRVLTIEKIKNEEAEKVRKIVAKDFHDEMGNHLASISVLVQLLKQKATSYSPEMEEMIEKIDRSSRTLFNGTKNFIWSIDPKNDKLYEALLYVKDFGEDLFDNTDINFYMDINHLNEKKIKLPPGWSRHIALIMKEALTNCLKHAKCKNVWVFIKLDGNHFKITIKDDGKGFCTENIKVNNNHFGLENMKFRASKIKCHLGINRIENAGMELVLLGDLPYFGL